ncbi:hypothetical protein BDEG_24543 [Batrachochytrium dendrobatidis JEL423]|uniref:Uncharacterized protein n=1 Tax=Batrachochytrium dendrobatidis (strain JEL423) TaxID=403673 RepID=A0A177WN43_BATDL|nr:hypothetical protein BDEG_24543 [Batrachochytrium dendrobatidis JEL423]
MQTNHIRTSIYWKCYKFVNQLLYGSTGDGTRTVFVTNAHQSQYMYGIALQSSQSLDDSHLQCDIDRHTSAWCDVTMIMMECVGVDIVDHAVISVQQVSELMVIQIRFNNKVLTVVDLMTAKHIRIQKLIQHDYSPVVWCDTVVRETQYPDICSVEHDESIVCVASQRL